MKICKNCVMDQSDPNITFNNEGVCDQCLNYKSKVQNFIKDAQENHTLHHIAKKIKKMNRGSEYDSIIGLSGGLDSSFLLHKIVTEYSLKPLVVHIDAGWNTEEAVHNINSLVDQLNLELFTEVINWKEMRGLQLAFFKSGVSHLDVPQDHAFISVLYNFANKYNIKIILNGGNFSTEGIRNPLAWLYYGSDTKQILDINKRFGDLKLNKYPLTNILWHKVFLKYFKGIGVLKPLNYFEYNKKQAEDILSKAYGCKKYRQKHFESRFTRFFEGYWLPKRFGYDTRKPQLSSLIVSGQMERDEAIKILSKPSLSKSQALEDFKYVASKLQISYDELNEYFQLPIRKFYHYSNQKWLYDLGAKTMRILNLEQSTKR